LVVDSDIGTKVEMQRNTPGCQMVTERTERFGDHLAGVAAGEMPKLVRRGNHMRDAVVDQHSAQSDGVINRCWTVVQSRETVAVDVYRSICRELR
jgi:hypothetical protein